jgi:glycosyltransferase involved in cell wall biosynthesis
VRTTQRLVVANIATAVPMGAQVYQEQVASRASAGLGEGWRVDRMVVRSLRSPLPGTHRLPMGFLTSASERVRRQIGRAVYPRGAVVHRMNLELPPAPHADVITLHDVVAWKFGDESAPVEAAAAEARRAAAVICVSGFTASEAVDLLGIEDPYVVPNGVDERYFDAVPLSAEVLAAMGVTGRFVLTGGGASERKNLAGLAEAWPLVRRARPDLSLVLSGPEHPRRTALFSGLPGVHLVGNLDPALVPGLMAAAEAVVVPSRYEGFGLPALEGMAVGVPVVAARTSSLPEVVGDAGLLVEPDAQGLSEGIVQATSGDAEVGVMVARGRARAAEFTWERSVAGHAAVWRDVQAGAR